MDTIALRYQQRFERYPDEDEEERWNGVALDFYLRTGDVPREVLHYKALARAGQFAFKYREDQPRVPPGNPDGGQWTYDGGSGSRDESEEFDGGDGNDSGDSGNDLPIEPASLRNRARAVGRAVGALRNWLRGERSPKPYDARRDPLTPNGELIGLEGNAKDVRTVSPSEFNDLRKRLLENSRSLPDHPTYDGRLYERTDGTQFGLRNSKNWGETIDVFKSPNQSIDNGLRIHQK